MRHSSLLTLVTTIGLPGQVLSRLEELLLVDRGDAELLAAMQDEALLLLLYLRHGTGLQAHPAPRPLDLPGAWRQLGSQRARAYLEALLLLSSVRRDDEDLVARIGRLRRISEALQLQCGSTESRARTLLRLLEVVPLMAAAEGRPCPHRTEWGQQLLQAMECPHLYHEDLVLPLEYVNDPVAAPPGQGRMAAMLALALQFSQQEHPQGEELSEFCRLLDVKPWQLMREGELHA